MELRIPKHPAASLELTVWTVLVACSSDVTVGVYGEAEATFSHELSAASVFL